MTFGSAARKSLRSRYAEFLLLRGAVKEATKARRATSSETRLRPDLAKPLCYEHDGKEHVGKRGRPRAAADRSIDAKMICRDNSNFKKSDITASSTSFDFLFYNTVCGEGGTPIVLHKAPPSRVKRNIRSH